MKNDELCPLELELLKKIGNNKTNEKYFADDVFVTNQRSGRTQLLSFYTYKGQVCIIDAAGWDNSFSDYDEENKKIIYTAIITNRYK